VTRDWEPKEHQEVVSSDEAAKMWDAYILDIEVRHVQKNREALEKQLAQARAEVKRIEGLLKRVEPLGV